MKNQFLLSCLIFLYSLTTFAQTQDVSIINIDGYTDAQIENIPKTVSKEGWVIISAQGKRYLRNYSNPDYILLTSLVCDYPEGSPYFLIEFSQNYRDGSYDGVDFISSKTKDHDKVVFKIDGQDFGDPFSKMNIQNLKAFSTVLKQGKRLTVAVYDKEFNPESATYQLVLNRSVDFKLGNAFLLDQKTFCPE